ncbi:hypothetical protein QUF72_21635 [Desulfobacterales bacterium HSG2]|nr:hypothetical protein [Desulfobacterales bacterium HSG2]
MNKIVRTPAPGWLKKKWEEWGKEWAKREPDIDKFSLTDFS